MKPLTGRNGLVIVLALIVLLGLSAIVAASAYMIGARTRVVASSIERAKALWLAEAGVQAVAQKLKTDLTYRTTPANIPDTNLGDGKYSVAVSGPVINGLKKDYTAVSTGMVGGSSRTISQTLSLSEWGEAFTEYAAFGGGQYNSMSLTNTATVEGDVYSRGTVSVDKDATITGAVYAAGGVSGSGTYTLGPAPEPAPVMPALDTSFYDNKIAEAGDPVKHAPGDQTYDDLDLAGGTIYVNGNVTISQGSTVTGPGMIVAKGDFRLSGNAILSEGITVISGATLDLQSTSTIRPQCVLYATNDFSLKQSGVLIDKTAIITPGNIYIWQTLTINGALFCGGNLEMKQSPVITGAAVVGGNITLTQGSRIRFSNATLTEVPPTGLGGNQNVSVILSNWSEL